MEEAKFLVRDAIRAGIFNDLGSGGNVDITVIAKVNHRASLSCRNQSEMCSLSVSPCKIALVDADE